MRSLVFICLLLVTLPLFAKEQEAELELCRSSREYITAINYLENEEDFKLDTKQMRDLADEISLGCTGAAERFVVVTKILLNAGLDAKSSVKKGIEYAKSSQSSYQMFVYAFKKAYLKRQLNLTLQDAIIVSDQVSQNLDGGNDNVRHTFDDVVSACHEGDMTLPPKQCAQTAGAVAEQVEKFNVRLGEEFNDLYNFIVSDEGPRLPTYKAVALAKELIQYGPLAKDNFIQAYKFARSEKGMAENRARGVEFAKKLTARSYQDAP